MLEFRCAVDATVPICFEEVWIIDALLLLGLGMLEVRSGVYIVVPMCFDEVGTTDAVLLRGLRTLEIRCLALDISVPETHLVRTMRLETSRAHFNHS